ncbi:MAG: hypothetical protein RBS88_00655 [Spongiibacteraceae bacterium]|jgi:hypothetical protein|nr:hypothetical protein [Spongiibacteraceae bacterium]
MEKGKITPNVVKTIESVLEERKGRQDRRQNDPSTYTGVERRSGKDRRKGE